MNIRSIKNKITSLKTDKLNVQHLKSDSHISFAYVQSFSRSPIIQ